MIKIENFYLFTYLIEKNVFLLINLNIKTIIFNNIISIFSKYKLKLFLILVLII